jgi:hypothetical protein
MADIEAARNSIIAALVGSCECNTKSPNAAFHAGYCRYLKLLSALDNLDGTPAAASPASSETREALSAKPDDNAWLKAKIRLSICAERGMTPWEAFEDAATLLLGLIRHNNDTDDPPMKWLIERLRDLATDLVADEFTPWIGERDPKQHICWTAADRLAALSAPKGRDAEDIRRETIEEWQPIETAPKDGTHLLVWQGLHGRQEYFECWWKEDSRYGGYWMDYIDSEPIPLFWMPLPKPPILSHHSTPEVHND